MYGTRSAIMMDITNPKVAATQFTAYMAMMNLAIAIAASWQGVAVEAWGYPVTLLVDAITGLACLCVPAGVEAAGELQRCAGRGPRAQVGAGAGAGLPGLAALLGESRAAGSRPADRWAPSSPWCSWRRRCSCSPGARCWAPARAAWRRAALWAAPLLLAMHGRYAIDRLAGLPALRVSRRSADLPVAAGGRHRAAGAGLAQLAGARNASRDRPEAPAAEAAAHVASRETVSVP